MKVCPKCGHPSEDFLQYCSQCGENLENVTAYAAPPPVLARMATAESSGSGFFGNNTSKKLKTVARIGFVLGVIVNIIVAIYMFVKSGDLSYFQESLQDVYIGAGFVFLFVGPVLSYINSLLIYAFGELVERAQEIAKNIKK